MNQAGACTICQEAGHRMNRCPELSKDLQPGFYKPAGGMPRGGDDEEDRLNRLWSFFTTQFKQTHSHLQSNNSLGGLVKRQV